MADIKVRGFVSKGAVKEGSNGKFATFTLAEGVKKKDGSYDNFFYNVTDFSSDTPPEDGSRVDIDGWLKLRYYDRGGVKQVSLDIQAKEIALVSPPKGGSKSDAAEPEKEPWE